MNSNSFGEENVGTTKPSRLRGWLSRTTPLIFGVEYTKCSPILAGQAASRADIVGRDIVLSKSPRDAVFYNVVPDPRIVSQVREFEFDYILGNSDATRFPDRKLSDGTIVYWRPLREEDQLSYDDPLIVRLNETHRDSAGQDLTRGDISPEWLCLRRAGHSDGRMFDDDGRLFVRSKKTESDDIIDDIIVREAIVGRIFSRFDHPLSDPRVTVAPHLPFAPHI